MLLVAPGVFAEQTQLGAGRDVHVDRARHRDMPAGAFLLESLQLMQVPEKRPFERCLIALQFLMIQLCQR
jgi:hypothetical protein